MRNNGELTESELRATADRDAKELSSTIIRREAEGLDASDLRVKLMFTMLNPGLNIVDQVMLRASGLDDGVREDMRNSIILHFERLITRLDLSIDLRTFIDRSAVESSLKLLHSAYPKIRDGALRRASRLQSTSFEIEDFHPASASAEDEFSNVYGDNLDDSDISDAEQAVKGLRSGARTTVGAAILHKMFNIPTISTPPDRAGKSAIARLIANQPEALRDSLLAHAYGDTPADRTLEVLWAQYDADQAADLAARDDLVALTVVTAALSPRPQLSIEEAKQLREVLRQGSRNAKWPALSRKLARAWAAEFTGPQIGVGECKLTDPPSGAWLSVCSEVLRFPGRPLGPEVHSPHDIDTKLEQIVQMIRSVSE